MDKQATPTHENRWTGVDELDDILARLEKPQTRDEYSDVFGELWQIAPLHVETLVRLYDAETYPHHPIVASLVEQTGDAAFNLFCKAMKDKDQYTRWVAAVGLSRCRRKKASELLAAALKDRSHLVKHVALDAMATARFRNPDAIPQLEKIIQSAYLQKHAPGFIPLAQKALTNCRKAL